MEIQISRIPPMTPVDGIARLKALLPGVKVVMFTACEDAELTFHAFENGADGYLLKQTPPEELLRAIADAHNGGAPMSSHVARLVVQSLHRPGIFSRPADTLTPREAEVLRLVAQGLINKEIAGRLGGSTETIRQHFKNCCAKLQVCSRTEAAMRLRG